jgi:hypothetical protein
MRVYYLTSLSLLVLCGCVTRTIDRPAFDRYTGCRALGGFYYTGSDSQYHFFATKYFLEPTHRYRMLRTEYPITNTFPRTRHRDLWVVWGVDLNSGTEGFTGEKVHLLSERTPR